MEYVYSDYIDAEGNVYPTVGENIRHGKNKSAVTNAIATQATPEPTMFFGYRVGRIIINLTQSIIANAQGESCTLMANGILYLNGTDPNGLTYFGFLGIDYRRAYSAKANTYMYASQGFYNVKNELSLDLRDVFNNTSTKHGDLFLYVYVLKK